MTQAHYTDGSAFQGPTNYGAPPLAPVLHADCATATIDPPSAVWVTVHEHDGATPPSPTPPLTDTAAIVTPYVGHAPGTFDVNVSSLVAGRQGFLAVTWNIGTGATAWVPFDCRPPASTTTTSTTSTTVPSSTTTSTTVAPPTTARATTTTAVAPAPTLPRTGAGSTPLASGALGLVLLGAALLAAVRRR